MSSLENKRGFTTWRLWLVTYYGSLLNSGVFGGSKLFKWLYKTSKQKKHISGCATIPFLIPFDIMDVPLQGILDELLSFCFLVPQQPDAIFRTRLAFCFFFFLNFLPHWHNPKWIVIIEVATSSYRTEWNRYYC